MRNSSRDNHAWRTPESIPNIPGFKLYVMTSQGAWEETEVVLEGRMHRLRGISVKDVRCWKPR